MKETLKFMLKFSWKVFYMGVAVTVAVITANEILHSEDWD